ncbi:CRE-ELC-2 protein [Caenorhabditis remanei]|uniref:Elongin-C n=1 Tax=Caenorhabditis remanei TaxID=31234 RepID=E3MNK3_CAERE|nr:CRE-ELC-2 protein [Caenorhabditis remanei]
MTLIRFSVYKFENFIEFIQFRSFAAVFLTIFSQIYRFFTAEMDQGHPIEDKQPKEKKLGGIDGPNSQYVKLVSSDAHEFIIKRELALTSGTIRAMLSGPGVYAENESNIVYFREIPSHVLQKVCQYFAYKVRYTHAATEIPEFPIPPEVALELLMAANFLDC